MFIHILHVLLFSSIYVGCLCFYKLSTYQADYLSRGALQQKNKKKEKRNRIYTDTIVTCYVIQLPSPA